MVRVLVAESDHAEELRVTGVLLRQGFDVSRAENGTAAIASSSTTDLVLLSLEQPDLDGLEVCRRIRAASRVPIVATGSKDMQLDLVVALRAGLDAYLPRPYGFRELVARVNAILRRTIAVSGQVDVISRGSLRINAQTREVFMYGRPISVTRKEFDLLHLLASEPDTLFTRRRIMSAVWEDEWAMSSRTIDTHVSTLRNKLGEQSAIITVRGIGFRIGCLRPASDNAVALDAALG
jgi:DNA-binding response OmpR family regulator